MISVLTPVYNGAEFIERTYWSLRQQTFEDWEWVVVDDGSTDQTAQILVHFGDDRIKLHRYHPNRGRGYARRLGLENAQGEWIAVWDADDLYFPDRLAKVEEARKSGFDFCVSYSAIVDSDFELKGIRAYFEATGSRPKEFVHHTIGCRTDLARQINYPEDRRVGEDATIVWTLAARYRGLYYEDAHAIYFEDREVNLEKAIQSNQSQLAQFKQLRETGVIGVGQAYTREVLRWHAKLGALQAMRLNPSMYRKTLSRRRYGELPPGWTLPKVREEFLALIKTRPWEAADRLK